MPVIDFDAATHTYRVDGRIVPSVTQILTRAGLVADYAGISPAVLAYARDRGSHVDACCDLLDADDLDWDSVHPECGGYVRAWQAFRERERFTPSWTQAIVYHDELEYAGMFDAYGKCGNALTLVERKCTSKIAETYAVQTAAYSMPGIGLVVDGSALLRFTVDRRLVVQLKPDGTYKMQEHTCEADFEAFKAACVIAKWRGANGNGK